jgi:hypothetical protein
MSSEQIPGAIVALEQNRWRRDSISCVWRPSDDEKTLDELRARIRKAIEYAQSIPARCCVKPVSSLGRWTTSARPEVPVMTSRAKSGLVQ